MQNVKCKNERSQKRTKREKENHKVKEFPEGPRHLIGSGALTWLKSERVSDRYGTVYLINPGENSLAYSGEQIPLGLPPDGQFGCLVAQVFEAKQSTHIGDFFRGLFPCTPAKGEIVIFGTGKFFSEVRNETLVVGVEPVEERESDWLNPRALYDVHESTVALYWISR